MKDLTEIELREVDGGSTNPTYYVKENYDGLAYSGSFLGGFFSGFIKAIFAT
jgi:hypothetical protein